MRVNHFDIRSLRAYAQVGEIPMFVKEAAEIPTAAVQALPPTSFADRSRELPIHSKAATWLSALRYFNTPESDWDQHTRSNLIKAASFWGIETEIWALADTVKKAAAIPNLDNTQYAVVVKSGDELVERRWPLLDGSSVKKASQGLWENRDRYPLAIRKEAASRILRRALELGVRLGERQEYIEKAAGYGIARADDLRKALRERRYLAKSAALRDRYVEHERLLQDLTGGHGYVSGEPLEKIAAFVDEADRSERLYRTYAKGVATPEELCYQRALSALEQEKTAAESQCLRDGTAFDFQALSGVPATQFAALGDDFVQAIAAEDGTVDLEKASALVPTLPIDDTSVFKRSLTL